MSNLVEINHEEFGIEESKAKQIAEQFKPMLDKMQELELEFNEVSKLDIEDPVTSKKAKELRLKYVKVRTGTAEIHKTQKAFYLQAGRFVDGWKNAQLFASQGIEDKLESIEKYQGNKEIERINNIQLERINIIKPYVENTDNLVLSGMDDEVWEAYLTTKKNQYNDKIEAERVAEENRLAEIKRQEEEREAQRLENIRLKKEAEEREALILEERKKAEAEKEVIRLANEKKSQEERKKFERIQAEKLKIENELKAKKEQEEREEKQRIADLEIQRKEQEKLAKAPIKKQMGIWVNSFELPTTSINNEVSMEIEEKFKLFKKWCLDKIEEI